MALNLGNITFGITADTSGLAAAQAAVQRFGINLSSSITRAKGDIDSATSALIKQEGAALKALQSVQQLQNKINSGGQSQAVSDALTKQLNDAYNKYSQLLTGGGKNPLNQLQSQRGSIGFTEQLQDIQRQLAAESAAAKQAQAATNALNTSFDRQAMSVQKVEFEVGQLIDKIQRLQSAGKLSESTAQGLIGRASTAAGIYSAQVSPGEDPLNAKQLQESSLQLKGVLNGVKADMSTAASATRPLSAAFRGLNDALVLSTGPFGMLAFRIQAATDLMKEYGLVIGGSVAATVGLGVAVVGLGGAMLHAEIQWQQADVTLKAITGSSTVAAGELDYLRDTANKAGLQFADLAPNFGRFEAAANATGQSLSVTHTEFGKLAQIMGTLHLNTQQTTNTVRTFDEIFSQGYVQTRNVVRQLATELPGAMSISGKAAEDMTGKIKLTGAEMEKLLSGKQLSGPEFVKAFIDEYAKFANVDLSHPIDTLQASLNRVNNEWNHTLTSLSAMIGFSDVLKGVLNGVVQVLEYTRTHLVQIVQTIAQFAGAMAGIGAAIAVMSILGPIVAGLTTAFRFLLAAVVAVREGETALAVVQTILNGLMSKNVVLGLATVFLSLVGALAGAKMALDAVNEAMALVNAKMVDHSAIDAYIASQAGLQTQVEATTGAYIKQAIAMEATQKLALNAAVADMQAKARVASEATQIAPKPMSQGDSSGFLLPGIRAPHATHPDVLLSDQATSKTAKDLADAKANVTDITNGLQKTTSELKALTDIINKPNDNTLGQGSKGQGPKTPNPYSGTSSINSIIQEAQAGKQAIADLMANPYSNPKLLDDLAKARDALYSISHSKDSGAQLAVVVGLMNQAGDAGVHMGDSLETITRHLEAFVTSARESKEVLEGWKTLQDDLTKSNSAAAQEQQRLNELMKGIDPDSSSFADSLEKANQALSKLHGNQELLQALSTELGDMGYNAGTLAERLGTALNRANNDKQLENVLKGINTDLINMSGAANQLRASTLGGLLDAGYAAQAEQALKGLSASGLAEVEQRMKDLGIATGNAAADFTTFLKQQDQMQQALNLHKQLLEQNITTWTQWSDSAVDSIFSVLEGTTKLGDGLRSIFSSFAKTIVQSSFIDPMKATIDQGIRNMLSGISGQGSYGPTGIGGIFQGILGVATGGGAGSGVAGIANATAQTAAQTALTASTTTAAGSLTLLDTAIITAATTITSAAATIGASAGVSGATGGAGGLGGIWSLFSFANGGQVSGPGTSISDSIPAMLSNGEFIVNAKATQRNLSLLHAINSGKIHFLAGGGVVTPNNAGAGGLFVPGLGTSAAQAASNSSASHYIDASTTIDARYSTPDAVEALRREMKMRDARLQSRLPQIIDSRAVDNAIRGRYQRV